MKLVINNRGWHYVEVGKNRYVGVSDWSLWRDGTGLYPPNAYEVSRSWVGTIIEERQMDLDEVSAKELQDMEDEVIQQILRDRASEWDANRS